MKTLICPISTHRISHHVARLTAFLMASMVALYLLTGNLGFILVIVIDYFIRAFTTLPNSPFSWLAWQIVRTAGWTFSPIDKAPKIFAARVGWLFAAATAVLYFIFPPASLLLAAVLMTFALLESVLDFCVGCLVYTYIVFPLMGEA
ncbi:MAG: DUF4395 domain-containing protein [Anaerolineaceae bacterium]|nr:DUF4395 domain-containing protein [Anaerolineaceae bacterium]